MADYIGSTTGIMKYAKESDAKEFIIGTENSIVQHLQFECPDKKFYPLSKDCVCHNMKLTTLMDVYNCVRGQGGEEIKLDETVRMKAKACIDTMLTLGSSYNSPINFSSLCANCPMCSPSIRRWFTSIEMPSSRRSPFGTYFPQAMRGMESFLLSGEEKSCSFVRAVRSTQGRQEK